MHLKLTATVLCLQICCTVSLAQTKPPLAPSQSASDVYHGVKLIDPFRNLEDLKNPGTQAWMRAQGDYASAMLSRIESSDALRNRILELSRHSGDRIWYIQRSAGWIAYLKRGANDNQAKLMIRDGLQGQERLLLDLNALSLERGKVPLSIDYLSLSPDGTKLVYGLSAAGSEDASLHLVSLPEGQALRAPIPRVPGMSSTASWSPDGSWLAFNQLQEMPKGAPDTETYMDSVIRVIDLTRPRDEPRAIFGPAIRPDLKLDRLDVGQLLFGKDSPWMIARTTDTTVPEGKLFIAPVSALGQAAPVPWQQISDARQKITEVMLRGDHLFVRSYANASRGRILRVMLPKADMSQAQVLVPEPARAVLGTFTLGQRVLYAQMQQGFGLRTLRFPLAQPGAGEDIAPSLSGLVDAMVDATASEADELWVRSVTWTMPPRIYAIDPRGQAPRDTGLLQVKQPAGTPALEVTEFEAESHDGTRVPVAVVHQRGLKLDGNNPTLLRGYGAYGMTTLAGFDLLSLAWFERGGVIAYVNPRGSGAYGDAWHRAGFKTTKPNTWKDGIAAARALITRGYATPKTLAVQGGSAGGIFAGRVVTEAPELFAAGIIDVGVLDAVRSEFSANGITNISEFGTVNDPAEFRALLAMSTYHHIKDGVAYPALLFTHGMNDARVDPWNSAKAVARLQQAQPNGKPVLLRLDAQAGHGSGETRQQGVAKQADRWAFLLWQFGRDRLKPARETSD